MAELSPEQRELKLVDSVDFRIANVANHTGKLQAMLEKYLCPLLLKLKSEHASVRNKTIEVCQRLRHFIKAPGVVLPVGALLDQFKANPDSELLRHYDQIFIQYSLGRLPLADRRQLVPKILHGIGSDVGPYKEVLFNFFLRLLPDIQRPPRGSTEDQQFRDIMFGDAKDSGYLASWLGDIFLLAGTLDQSQKRGLTEDEFNFLTLSNPDTWSPEKNGLSLGTTCRLAVLFLETGAFTDEERLLPALCALAHADSAVSTVGNDMLKRTTVSFEHPVCVDILYDAYEMLGWPVRIRILRLLTKSKLAATCVDGVLLVFTRNYRIWDSEDSHTKNPAGEYTGYKPWVIESAKLLVRFLNWTVRVSPNDQDFSRVARSILESCCVFLTDVQGFPKPLTDRQTADDRTLRCIAYQIIGSMGSVPGALDRDKSSADHPTVPFTDDWVGPLVTYHAQLMIWLLRALAQDPVEDAVVHIDSALSSVTSTFKPRTDPILKIDGRGTLLQWLARYLTASPLPQDIRSNRHAIVRIANQCYPFGNASARWIDVLAVSRPMERKDVVEEGERGLDPRTYFPEDKTMVQASVGPDQAVVLPDWKAMAGYFHAIYAMNQPSTAIMAHAKLGTFVKQLLFLTALRTTDFRFVPGWQHQLDVLVKTDKDTRDTIRQYLRAEGEIVHSFLLHVLGGVGTSNDPDTLELTARNFLEVASLAPASTLEIPEEQWSKAEIMYLQGRRQLQLLWARIQGIIVNDIDPTRNETEFVSRQLCEALDTLTKSTNTEPRGLHLAEGRFLSSAYSLSRLVFRGQEIPVAVQETLSQRMPSLLKLSPSSSFELALEGLIQLWTAGISPVSHVAAAGQVADRSAYLTELYIEPLAVQAKQGNEKAITALGRLAMVVDDDDVVDSVLNKLYDLHEMKQTEIHFAIGEAIVASVACWDSDALQLAVDVEPFLFEHRRLHRAGKLSQALEKLVSDSKQTKPSLIKASGIWLFCMIQYCSHLSEVQSRLRSCQVAFMRLLGSRDELVQETASRGLAVVYEKGDESIKESLVRDFVAAFTGSTVQIKVDEETELFEAGALPTGDGNSVTSYKDIVSLANEVGDQTLIYKFMSLANNAHTWAARSAFGRFGLTNILSVSDVDPKLYPKLFRYRFDPNTNVQKSMDDIWKALVKDSNEVLDKYFDDILQDLLVSVLGREWRVREASCAAISDLIQGRPFVKYEKYYQQIWASALKVLDDVKATVRSAAQNLCDALSNTLVHQVELSGSSEATRKMMQEGLPFLLSDKGIESTTQEVKLIATGTILRLTKSGGKALQPFIPDMVTKLLGLLSTLEPEQVNYLYNRTNEDNREKLDKFRAQMVTRGPLVEAIENLLRNVDGGVMEQLVAQLEDVMKTAVGMPSKIGCAQVLGTLATRHAEDFKPYSSRFLLTGTQIMDRNDEVSMGYAKATAYMIRVAPDQVQIRFMNGLIQLYMNSENETQRQKVADAVLAISKISPDHFNALAEFLVPFTFLGKHDTDEYVHKAFEESWSKHAGSSLTITRYAATIAYLIGQALERAQWALKHGGALASASLVLAVTGTTTVSGYVNEEHLKKAWPVFETSLALKTFVGKEKLLPAFSSVVSKGKSWWEKDAKLAETLKTIAVREAKRNNKAYRPHAFECLSQFAAAREDLEMLGEISSIVQPFIAEFVEDAEMKDSSDKAGQAAVARGDDSRSKTVRAAIEAIAKGYNRPNLRKDPIAELSRVIMALEGQDKTPADTQQSPILARPLLEPVRRAYWYDCVAEIVEEASKAQVEGGPDTGDGVATLLWLAKTLDLDNNQLGTEKQRLARARAALGLCTWWKNVPVGDKWLFRDAVLGFVQQAVEEERSPEVKQMWQSCLTILQSSGFGTGRSG